MTSPAIWKALGSAWILAVGLCLADTLTPSPNHWAYQPLQRPTPPSVPGTRSPVDRFVQARLQEAGLKPAPPANSRALLRRVSLDLTGLPPTPEALQAFVSDTRPEAYERAVDQLLASPRYGERWARHWMDAAHFAESHGHDQDRIRTNAWPYRDYLIRSFNNDKPYAQFVAEQVAGDVLRPEDPDATVAMGFVAAGPWDESSLRDIREDTLDRQIARYLDRDDMLTTVMQTFASTTVQCARCHDHKFDPVSQADYYALQAVFAGVDRGNRYYDPDPELHQRRRALQQEKAFLESLTDDGLAKLATPDALRSMDRWLVEASELARTWKVFSPVQFQSSGGALLQKQPDDSILSTGPKPERDVVTLDGAAVETRLVAIRLEVLTDASLPQRGPGRNENGNLHLSELQLWAKAEGATAFERVPLVSAEADFNQEGWGIARAVDDNESTAWGIYPQVGRAHEAVFRPASPMEWTRGTQVRVVLKQQHGGGHLLGRFRLSFSATSGADRLTGLPENIRQILATPASARKLRDAGELVRYGRLDAVQREMAKLPAPALVYAAASDFVPDGSLVPAKMPRPIHVLRRGEITKPTDPAAPGSLSCIRALPARFQLPPEAREGVRRAALAEWLVSEENPLVWRSIVNRVWHWHFGRGLVETPNDFGRMGSTPSHPELLDWLATWFRDDAHGSLKALHRLLVTSETYKQTAAHVDPKAAALDQDNRLLWRMNRLRLDAEQIRDAVLQASGRLDLRMGGPSDRQFDLKPGIHVTPLVDYTRFDLDSEAGARRSTYRFLFRTLPDPFMDALDCPAGDQLTAVRNASVTVQQALALWNNAFMARHAELLAQRLEREQPSLEAQIQRANELLFARPPTPDESRQLGEYARKHGLANLCRLLLNTNEFLFLD